MDRQYSGGATQAGFSLIELMIAMTITLIVMTLASSMIAQSFNVRSRENTRTESIADAQRALNTITRDIANAGLGLSSNGIVSGDSTATSVRIRSNLDGFTETTQATNDDNEDVKYRLINDANGQFIIRQNLQGTATTTVLANRVDNLRVRYFKEKVTYDTDPPNCNITNVSPTNTVATPSTTNEVAANPELAKYIVVAVCVQLPAVGTQGSAGYQPLSRTMLVSDVVLRNASTALY